MRTGCYIINHNYSEFMQYAIRSIVAQTKKPDVLIFIDDKSTDDSIEVLQRECIKQGDIFDDIIVNDENLGCPKTINKVAKILIEDYNCELIFGLSSDDVMHKEYIEKTYNAMINASKDVGYIYTHVEKIGDKRGVDVHPEFSGELLRKYPFVHGSSLVKAEAWQAVGGVPEIDFEEDYRMWLNMLELGYIGKLIPEVLLYWRFHGKNRTLQGLRNRGAL